jgi:hypothetical protein
LEEDQQEREEEADAAWDSCKCSTSNGKNRDTCEMCDFKPERKQVDSKKKQDSCSGSDEDVQGGDEHEDEDEDEEENVDGGDSGDAWIVAITQTMTRDGRGKIA